MEKEAKNIVLIDSNAVIHRSYHALPKSMSTSKGELTNAVYGYTTTLIKALEDLKPAYLAASFDISKATFRTEVYADYKVHRVAVDQELYDQIPKVRKLLEVLNIPIYEMAGFEADDCIGTIVSKVNQLREKTGENYKVFVISGDKDIYQLIDDNIFVYSLKKGLSKMEVVDCATIKEEYGLDPEDFIDLKALAGDPSDNIPGVPGIGPKTATDLIQRFDSLVKLYETIEAALPEGFMSDLENSDPDTFIENCKLKIENCEGELVAIAKQLNLKPRILNLLITHKAQAFLSQHLATIKRDVPIDFDLEKCKWGDYNRDDLQQFFESMQFHSLLRRFGAEPKEAPKTASAQVKQKQDEQLKLL